jgi:RNA polymerase sigma-70 factor (ECF subfamily)
MDESGYAQRLSRITTLWGLVQDAHGEEKERVKDAQRALMEQYSGAIYRYLLGATRDTHAADELFQEFSLRFVRGDFRRANPEKGRFRDFVKTSLFHLIVDYQKKKRHQPREFSSDHEGPVVHPPEIMESDKKFLQSWRDELIDRAWSALAQCQRDSGQPYYHVLRFRAENPDLSSPAMADRLSAQLKRSLTPEGVRQILHRARAKFAELLLDDLIQSLEGRGDEDIEQELIDLDLSSYCRPIMDKRRKRA